MKNKLHTTSCHLEVTRDLISKFPNFQIFLFSILYSLSSIQTTAQPYQWDWAVNGGGSMGSGGWDYQVEQVFDIAIDKNNNYYFIAKINNGTPQLNGQPVTVYGNPQGGNDIFLFSTTCDGQVRWSQTIGGGDCLTLLTKLH